MSKLLQVGISYPHEMKSGIGHVAVTLGGVNYESRGGRGCLKGRKARGATDRLFRHQFHRTLSDRQAARAKKFADSCVGQPYVWGGIPAPNKGGDCSGYASVIICAISRFPRFRRLFATGTWKSRFAKFRFAEGLGPAAAVAIGAAAGAAPARRTIDLSKLRADIKAGHITNDIVAIQRALNRKVGSDLKGTGFFGPVTKQTYSRWQRKLGFSGSVDQPGSAADGLPGPYSLERLGFRAVA